LFTKNDNICQQANDLFKLATTKTVPPVVPAAGEQTGPISLYQAISFFHTRKREESKA
jgi:hypothetical protein